MNDFECWMKKQATEPAPGILNYSWLEHNLPEGNIFKFKGKHLAFYREN